MNKIFKTALPLLGCIIFAVPQAQATDLSLTGSWSYNINGARGYKKTPPAQSGRVTTLGAGYYKSGYIKGGEINNDDYYRSGSLSLNFWRVSLYGGSYGYLLFARSYNQLSADYYYPKVYKSGYFKSPGSNGYGKITLSEYYTDGWYTADSVNFSKYQYF
jgi:hypothetical protein